MSDEIQYQYCEVGDELVKNLLLHIQRGESFVLLGSQGGGKRHALTLLGKRLERENRSHLSIFFRDNHTMVTEAELLDALKHRLRHFHCDEIVAALSAATGLVDWFKRLGCEGKDRTIPISFANIDWLADPLKEEFLTLVRDAVQQRQIIAVLTGESLLARTLAKVTSPFQCVYQFVLTGHDKETSRTFFLKRVHACQIKFHDRSDPSWNATEAFECFYAHVGGNINLLRAALWCLSERRLRFEEDLADHAGYTRRTLDQNFINNTSVPLFGLKPFHTAKSLIHQDADVLRRLEELLDQVQAACDRGLDPRSAFIEASIPVREHAPEPLELAGFMRRDPQKNVLVFPSIYAAEFAIRYFSWSCRGDFHAKQGNWQKAFECYEKVNCREKLRRPIGVHDFQIVRTIVNRLCREFAERITKDDSIKQLRELLDNSGRLLFGLRTARVLQINDKGAWVFDGDQENSPNDLDARVQAICQTEPIRSTRKDPQENYALYQDSPRRTMVVQGRPGQSKRAELNPRHALLFESDVEGPVLEGLRLRLLETVATNFLTCFDEARLRRRMLGSRLRLGSALRELFSKETVRKSLEALGEYLQKEFDATGVRLFLLDISSGDLRSAKSWGYKNAELQREFDSGLLILKRSEEPELWAALTEGKPIAFRWGPKDHSITPATTDLQFRVVRQNAHSAKVERQPGDYWIDFPLFIADKQYGKLTLAFPSHAPPPLRYMDDLNVISEILTHHLKWLELNEVRLAEMQSLQQRAIAVAAHRLATRVSNLPIFLHDYRELEITLAGKEKETIARINSEFEPYLETTMTMLDRAKRRLAEVKPVYSEVDLAEVAREALRGIDSTKGGGSTEVVTGSFENGVVIEADKIHMSEVFLELVSNSITMHPGGRHLKVIIQICRVSETDSVIVDYLDNGPGVPDDWKKKIFDYLTSYRPGQERKGLGLGLGYASEAIRAHGGSIEEVGTFGIGAHFRIVIPIKAKSL
jgi:signal transduction histidine kinase